MPLDASSVKDPPRSRKPASQRSFFENLGPGLITGAADNDPSGISTYSVAGAAFGYGTLWTALVTLPMTAAIQLMCARLGAVTGHGLAHEVRLHYSRGVLLGVCALLAVANVVNLGADLGGMAEVTGMISGASPLIFVPIYAGVITALLLWTSYRLISQIFKWLTLVLFAYILTAFLAHPDWRAALLASIVPHASWTRDFLSTLVAILGTTISPYLFFWQASQEVEERRAQGDTLAAARKPESPILRGVQSDVLTGMMYSNLIMYFIILTTAATLHHNGMTTIATAREAAQALLPLAGRGAYWLFALGLIGTGMLGVPILAGSCAYVFAEAAAWRGTLEAPPRKAPQFYAVIGAAIAIGLALNFAGVSAIRMLFWAAIVNGLLAPPLILLVILLTSNRQRMGEAVSSPLVQGLGWATFALMSAAAIGMFVVSM